MNRPAARFPDQDGVPIGYRVLTGVEFLTADDRVAFEQLSNRFRFKDVKSILGGKSDSNALRLLKKCLSLDLVKRDGHDYVKVSLGISSAARGRRVLIHERSLLEWLRTREQSLGLTAMVKDPAKVEAIPAQDLDRYIAERRAKKMAAATINREIGGLKQAFNLARKHGRLSRVPYFPMMREDNARQGFFEHSDFEKVVAELPEPINDIARFAYLSAWRRGEIVPLRWDAVDRTAREVRLRTSKNGLGRVPPLEGELWTLIERRWAARTVEQEDATTKICELVFHRAGEPIVDFRKIWDAAFTKAKTGRRLFHDLRRTAVRNMVRAGVPQSVAMTISGHKTASMFQRYNVTSGTDQVEALKKTAAHLAALPKSDKKTILDLPQAAGGR